MMKAGIASLYAINDLDAKEALVNAGLTDNKS